MSLPYATHNFGLLSLMCPTAFVVLPSLKSGLARWYKFY